ncbi:MAG: hydrolase [Bacilli bacterium]|nr:hydrolase [Bacilli bacterium]
MDSGTHLVIGLGLAGLAYIDPVIASDTTVSTAVLIGTVLGSQAPDADGLLRIKGNAAYIKNHRGLSHSLPAVLLWTLFITFFLSIAFHDLPLAHVGIWVLIAVSFHVFTDLFNTYGTQAARPFSEKWIAWNIIHIFDPFIFVSHLLAIFMWSVHLEKPAIIFPTLYVVIALYYVVRTIYHKVLTKGLSIQDLNHQNGDQYLLIPTINLYVWHVVKKQKSGQYVLGEYKNHQLKWIDSISCADHPAVDASKQHPDIASFLYFSTYACAELKERTWGYEVRWVDVRYRHRKQYPFVAVLLLTPELEPIDSYVGWLSESRIEKKFRINPR